MIILGIDPGLKATGYGVINAPPNRNSQVKLLETGTIEAQSRASLSRKIENIYRHLSDVISQYQPDVMVLEKLYSHYAYPTTACILGHARGVICLAGSHKGIKLVEYPVKRIRKALLGNGNASKQQTRECVARILSVKAERLTLDSSDALALALGYTCMKRT